MKTINLTLLCFILGATTLFGQQSEKHIFDIRAYGGVSVLQLTSDNTTSLIDGVIHDRSVTGRPGFQFGASLTYGNRMFIQPGVQYSILSTTVNNKNTVTGNELTDETTLNIISVPLKVGFRFVDPAKENLINGRIFGGIDGQHISKVNHSTKSNKIDDIDESDYHNLILNADFGLGLDVWIFYLDLGYQMGISPVHTGGDSSKANSFYGNLGLRFTFGD